MISRPREYTLLIIARNLNIKRTRVKYDRGFLFAAMQICWINGAALAA